jgi:hypothetical protein
MDIIKESAGRQFHPEYALAFLKIRERGEKSISVDNEQRAVS